MQSRTTSEPPAGDDGIELDLVAIDGKTSRRSHNRKTGQKTLHLVSAFATNTRLVRGR